ncbi:MAG: hypothetical protein RLZZ385_305 [Pseudomonadota bacterium]|jgi:selenocysteine lyase/cysteine desulfurase
MDSMLIKQLRLDTPGCQGLIHFNNAGCALSPNPVLDAVIRHLSLEQQLGGYEAAEQAADTIERFYPALADLLHCQPDEIAWVENSTRAWDLALHSLPWQAGDRIIAGQTEYASNLLALLQLQDRRKVEITVIDNDPQGRIDLDQLRLAIDGRVRLICLTHVASQHGVVQPAAVVGEIAAEHGILFLLDACQSAGQIPIDVRTLGCHMLTGSGRKFLRGPRGTGFLFVRRDVLAHLEPPFIDLQAASWVSPTQYRLREDARRFENWESFVAGRIGLAVAVDYAVALGLESIQQRIAALAGSLRQQLAGREGVTVFEPLHEPTGIVTFARSGVPAEQMQSALRQQGINVGVSRRATAQLDFTRRGLHSINRASLHYYNDEQEIDRLLMAVDALGGQ